MEIEGRKEYLLPKILPNRPRNRLARGFQQTEKRCGTEASGPIPHPTPPPPPPSLPRPLPPARPGPAPGGGGGTEGQTIEDENWAGGRTEQRPYSPGRHSLSDISTKRAHREKMSSKMWNKFRKMDTQQQQLATSMEDMEE